MSADKLPPLPKPDRQDWTLPDEADYTVYSAETTKAYGQACRVDLLELIRSVHKAKGRYHSQHAMCDLYDAAGLPNTRPEKSK